MGLRYEVAPEAALSYFLRLHERRADLTPLLRQPATLADLASLTGGTDGMAGGGFVFAHRDGLRFYPWTPLGARRADRGHDERLAIYRRLLPRYLEADPDGLLAGLATPGVRRLLGAEGIGPSRLEVLAGRLGAAARPEERLRVLRQAGHLLSALAPYHRQQYALELGDKLRFHAAVRPAGRYVGLFVLRGPLDGVEEPPPTAGHRFVIHPERGGERWVEHHHRGRRRLYRLRAVAVAPGHLAWGLAVHA